MKVCYLTWGETPRSYGVFGSQVIGQFVETHKSMPDDQFYFVSGVPLIHSGLLREKFKYGEEINKVKEKLGGIRFITVPIFASQNFVNPLKRTFNIMHRGAHFLLANVMKRLQPDVLHCRSYHAAWAALKIKEKYHFHYKIVFDARGLWPEEMGLVKKLAVNDENYFFFKDIERELLTKCNATIAVSDTMAARYHEIKAKRIETIYLSVDAKKLGLERTNPHKTKNLVKYCYIGALTNDTWHRTDDLLKLYLELRKKTPACVLKIITTSSHDQIRKIFAAIPQNELILTSTKNVEELKIELGDVDFGLLPYRKSTSFYEDIVGNSMLGTKTVEYAAAGIPVIVNEECGGASLLINQYQLGFSYNPDSFAEITEKNIAVFLNDGKSSERSALAEKLFDYASNALKYKGLYIQLYHE